MQTKDGYLSLENDEPILEIKCIDDIYYLFSNFTLQSVVHEVEITQFIKAVEEFLNNFKLTFFEIFNIDIETLKIK